MKPALQGVDLQVQVLPHAVSRASLLAAAGELAGGSQRGLQLADQVCIVHVDHGEDPLVAVQDPHHHLVQGHGEKGASRQVPLLEPRLPPDYNVRLCVD
eukprot:2465204-Rhodomonas_salina.1